MASKTSPKWRPKSASGAPLKFLEDHLGFSGEECLKWPFTTNVHGRGMIRWNGMRTSAHRVMCWLKFGPPPVEGMEAAHSCGKGHEGCVNPNHLSWKTTIDNKKDRIAHGTHGTKFTSHDVVTIRSLKGIERQKDIAARYGVDREAIGRIWRGKTWRWL